MGVPMVCHIRKVHLGDTARAPLSDLLEDPAVASESKAALPSHDMKALGRMRILPGQQGTCEACSRQGYGRKWIQMKPCTAEFKASLVGRVQDPQVLPLLPHGGARCTWQKRAGYGRLAF